MKLLRKIDLWLDDHEDFLVGLIVGFMGGALFIYVWIYSITHK